MITRTTAATSTIDHNIDEKRPNQTRVTDKSDDQNIKQNVSSVSKLKQK